MSKIKGDVKQVFDKLDEDKSGTIDVHEIKKLLVMLSDDEGASITDTMVEEVMKEVDKDNDGSIDFAEFTVWYVKSEQRLKNEEMKIFHQFDTEQKGYITLDKLGSLLHKMHVHYTPLQLQQAQNHFQGTIHTIHTIHIIHTLPSIHSIHIIHTLPPIHTIHTIHTTTHPIQVPMPATRVRRASPSPRRRETMTCH